ncbi:MAG TPA: YMGG-like glycine zipper-containing protein [Rhizomicrobium sp.]|nr:YMGG-like glycine zipper-containing protein [Rhizomicrobium sp.]
MKTFRLALLAVSSLTLLAGCVSQPYGPDVPARPGPGKSFSDFRNDDNFCQDYASDKVAGHVNEANDRAVRNGLVGTIVGAALGAAVGNTRGAVVGGAAGATIGASSGAGYSQYGVQRQYDIAYAQCMASRGEDVPGWYERPDGDDRDQDSHDRDDRDRDYHDGDRGDDRDYPPPPPPSGY